ncbi:hypothetical protein EDB19DRAFT_1778866 [Suillus lakei]|nr:hypothetical protein EDB19DRAFT_1778866 [Suillus lakei]
MRLSYILLVVATLIASISASDAATEKCPPLCITEENCAVVPHSLRVNKASCRPRNIWRSWDRGNLWCLRCTITNIYLSSTSPFPLHALLASESRTYRKAPESLVL